MNNASIISIVSNLLKERDYYEESFKECRAIIKQLTEGPGEIEYTHPFDLDALLNDPASNSIVDIWKLNSGKPDLIEFPKTGKKYKRSVFIPPKYKNLSN